MKKIRDFIKEHKNLVYVILIILGIINFMWTNIEAAALGGDALNGSTKDGRYYVSEHGSTREETKLQWKWSLIHSVSLFITHPLAIFSGYKLLKNNGLKR